MPDSMALFLLIRYRFHPSASLHCHACVLSPYSTPLCYLNPNTCVAGGYVSPDPVSSPTPSAGGDAWPHSAQQQAQQQQQRRPAAVLGATGGAHRRQASDTIVFNEAAAPGAAADLETGALPAEDGTVHRDGMLQVRRV